MGRLFADHRHTGRGSVGGLIPEWARATGGAGNLEIWNPAMLVTGAGTTAHQASPLGQLALEWLAAHGIRGPSQSLGLAECLQIGTARSRAREASLVQLQTAVEKRDEVSCGTRVRLEAVRCSAPFAPYGTSTTTTYGCGAEDAYGTDRIPPQQIINAVGWLLIENRHHDDCR